MMDFLDREYNDVLSLLWTIGLDVDGFEHFTNEKHSIFEIFVTFDNGIAFKEKYGHQLSVIKKMSLLHIYKQMINENIIDNGSGTNRCTFYAFKCTKKKWEKNWSKHIFDVKQSPKQRTSVRMWSFRMTLSNNGNIVMIFYLFIHVVYLFTYGNFLRIST